MFHLYLRFKQQLEFNHVKMLSIHFGNYCFVCSRRDKKPIKKKLPKKKGDLPDKQVKVKTFSCPDKRLRKSVHL